MYNDYSDFSDLDAFAGTGVAFGTLFTVFAAVWLAALAVVIVLYIVKAIPIYILSKKAGRNYPWLAFIPLGQNYALITIGEGPVNIPLIKKSIAKRSTAFWILLAISIGTSVVSMIISAITGIFMLIPVVGVIIDIIVSILFFLVAIAVAVLSALFNYAFYYDIFKLYQPESTNNQLFAVLCAISPFICADILSTIFLYTLIKKEPVFNPEEQETIVVS